MEIRRRIALVGPFPISWPWPRLPSSPQIYGHHHGGRGLLQAPGILKRFGRVPENCRGPRAFRRSTESPAVEPQFCTVCPPFLLPLSLLFRDRPFVKACIARARRRPAGECRL